MKKIIIFTIKGNHKSPTGNAVSKLKMTGKQHWTPKAKEYVAWKNHVVYSLLKELRAALVVENNKILEEFEMQIHKNIAQYDKPIVIKVGSTSHMRIDILWKNEAHGDPENIFGSIADALFYDDKHLAGEFHFAHSGEHAGMVKVELTIND